MPILGVIASAIAKTRSGAYESIATVVASGSSGTITFSSIPQTYTHLQLRYISRDARAGSDNSPVDLTFNGSSATAYNKHVIEGNGSTGSAGAELSQNFIRLEGGGNASPSETYGVGITDILDYTSTTKRKTILQIAGVNKGSIGFSRINSGQWYASPVAITSLTLTAYAPNFAANSHFALYGIKES